MSLADVDYVALPQKDLYCHCAGISLEYFFSRCSCHDGLACTKTTHANCLEFLELERLGERTACRAVFLPVGRLYSMPSEYYRAVSGLVPARLRQLETFLIIYSQHELTLAKSWHSIGEFTLLSAWMQALLAPITCRSNISGQQSLANCTSHIHVRWRFSSVFIGKLNLIT